MKTKFTQIAAGLFLWLSSAQAQVPCATDLNGFVNYKNLGSVGAYQLSIGLEEKASQTYYYSGPGKISSVRVAGSNPDLGTGVPLKIGVYNVDASGRPTTEISSVNYVWYDFLDNSNGFIDVTFPGGVLVNNKFAISVEVLNAKPFGEFFNLGYTGNLEGGMQDLASLAGTSTGFNWTSAKNSFNKDGDFYLVPNMENLNIPKFKTITSCYSINSVVSFSNTSQLTKDSMFNKIAFINYSGSNKFYSWNFGDGSPISNAMNPTHTFTAGGVYTVSLTTTIEGWTNTCVNTYTVKISVGLSAFPTSITNVTCFDGTDGSFVANGQFGAPPYSYSIYGNLTAKNTTMSTAWQTNPNFTLLYAGNYVLYVMDAVGCISTTTFVITQPEPILFNPISITNSSCGNATGAINASATGGLAPLQYKMDLGSFQATGSFTNIMAGTHTLVVQDANACTSSTLVIVNDFGGPTLNTPNVVNVSCFGGNDGSITLSSTGGTGLIQYSIDGGANFQTSGVFTNVSAGTYVCIVKDNATCTDNAIVIVSQGPSLTISATSIPALCNGESNGQINVSSAGGTGFHNYSINGIGYQSGTNFSGLDAGNYTIYVKDVTGCIKTTTVIVLEPAPLSIILTNVPVTCNGLSDGVIGANAVGGNGYYSYSIDGINFEDIEYFKNFPAGSYNITVRDSNNCTFSTPIAIAQPAAITATVNTTNSTCTFTNGSIMAIAGGGSGSGYQYSIDGGTNYFTSGLFSPLPAGTKFIVIKDGAGCKLVVSGIIQDSDGPVITSSSQQNVSCNGGKDGTITINTVTGGTGLLQYSKNGINWQTSPILSGLEAGVYVIQVRDANGCTGTITKTITEPNAFLIATTSVSVSCFGSASGSATITASGGAGFLAYSINGGISYQSGAVFSNLAFGTYTVIVRDAASCIGSSEFLIAGSSKILLNVGVLNVACNGADNGALSIKASGGVAPYLYSLDGNNNYSSINTFVNLPGNTTYYPHAKDANSCIVSTTQFISEPTPVTIVPVINHIACAGGANGSINLNVNGGVSPYTYQWSNGSASPTVSNLTSGVYSVTINDFNGCSSVRSYTINQPSNPLVVNGLISVASNTSSTDGAIDITINGGVGPYMFNWSNGATTEDISGLGIGSYMVTITDVNGCTTSATYNVGISTGIENIQITGSEVKVYPNPANEYAVIEAKGYRIEKVELVNLLGQKVYIGEVNDSMAKINLENLLNGTYFVKIYFKNNTVTKKIIISK